MLRNRMCVALATAAVLLSDFYIATARAEETAVPKRGAYPKLQPAAKPGMTAAEQEKLKKELSNVAARVPKPKGPKSARNHF
jgi:hypothetical protein